MAWCCLRRVVNQGIKKLHVLIQEENAVMTLCYLHGCETRSSEREMIAFLQSCGLQLSPVCRYPWFWLGTSVT